MLTFDCLYFAVLRASKDWWNVTRLIVIYNYFKGFWLSNWRQIDLTSSAHQNRARSLQDLMPEFSSGLYSLIQSDSRNASLSQLLDLRMISVLSRTALIWRFIVSMASPLIWRRPTISFQWGQLPRWLYTALFLSHQPCCLVRLNRVVSVLPI